MNFMRFLNAEKSKKLALFSLSALLIVGGAAWFYDYGQWTLHAEHRERIAGLKNDIMKARRFAVSFAQASVLRPQIQKFVDDQEATMVSGDQFVWVTGAISQLAELHPVGGVTTQPGSVVPHSRKPSRQCYVTRLEFTGDYDQIGMFVQELENHFPQAELRSLNIVATETPAIHRATLELALLVRAPVKTGAKS